MGRKSMTKTDFTFYFLVIVAVVVIVTALQAT